MDASADLVDCGGAVLNHVERVEDRDGVVELVLDCRRVSGERIRACGLHLQAEVVAALTEPRRMGLPGRAPDPAPSRVSFFDFRR